VWLVRDGLLISQAAKQLSDRCANNPPANHPPTHNLSLGGRNMGQLMRKRHVQAFVINNIIFQAECVTFVQQKQKSA